MLDSLKWMRLFVLGSGILFATSSFADCGFSQVQIKNATEFEAQSTCDSLGKVLNLFKSVGIQVDPVIHLSFEDQAEVVSGEEHIPVHGYFDDETFEMHITHFGNPKYQELEPFGVPWEISQDVSYVLHEMTHLVAAMELSKKNLKLQRVWHEFVAYSVQLQLMDSKLRDKILANPSAIDPFANPEDVNEMYYEMNPDGFGIKAYKSMKAWGGMGFIKKVLQGEVPVALRKAAP